MKRMMMICLQGIGAGLAISIGGTVYLSVEQPEVCSSRWDSMPSC